MDHPTLEMTEKTGLGAEKVPSQGEPAVSRALSHAGMTAIEIPMTGLRQSAKREEGNRT